MEEAEEYIAIEEKKTSKSSNGFQPPIDQRRGWEIDGPAPRLHWPSG
jgi:hypothetical protein